MKISFVLLIGIMYALNCYAQSSKIYIDASGKFSTEAKNAISYDLLEKVSDTVYLVRNYDMRDTITSQGVYKDEQMTIPNGRFIYYTRNVSPGDIKPGTAVDTNNYIFRVGYYLNGVKTGLWVDYSGRRIKKNAYTYKNNKQNGLYQSFDGSVNNYVITEGNIVNNKREGIWNMYVYNPSKTPFMTTVYSHNNIVKQTVHLRKAKTPYGFKGYFLDKLRAEWDTIKNHKVMLQLTVNTDGTIKNVKMIYPISPAIDALIVNVILKSGKFTPEFYDNKAVERVYYLWIDYLHNRVFYDGGIDIIMSNNINGEFGNKTLFEWIQ